MAAHRDAVGEFVAVAGEQDVARLYGGIGLEVGAFDGQTWTLSWRFTLWSG